MVFSNKKRRHYDLNVKIDETRIEEVKKNPKFVGVIIDNKLTWKDRVAHVASKVSRGMGMIIKARNYLNRKGLLTLYYTLVYPYLTYFNHIWGNIYQSNSKRLCVLQSKIVHSCSKVMGFFLAMSKSGSLIQCIDLQFCELYYEVFQCG